MRIEQGSSSANDRVPHDDFHRGMRHWRWLVFALLARLQQPENEYLRVPNAISCDVDVKIP